MKKINKEFDCVKSARSVKTVISNEISSMTKEQILTYIVAKSLKFQQSINS